VSGKNVSVTAMPSMTQVAVHDFVASTLVSSGVRDVGAARLTVWLNQAMNVPVTTLPLVSLRAQGFNEAGCTATEREAIQNAT
jgi:hypothetical protein